MRILLVTDSHLAPGSRQANANWQRVREFAERANAVLTLHLGDITRDGWSAPKELPHAAKLAEDWPTPIRFLPGNHDIGDNPPGPDVACKEPLSADHLALYRSIFGPDHWALEDPRGRVNWVLIGLNAQLFGTGTEDEHAQWDWLEAAIDSTHDRPVAIFSHKPLFQNSIASEPPHIRYIPNKPRARLRKLLAKVDCRLFISGHTHQFRERQIATTRHIWVPSSAYRFPDAMQDRIGDKIVGVGLLDIDRQAEPQGFRFDLVCPEGMQQFEFRMPAKTG